jgi:mercuric ion transport protein
MWHKIKAYVAGTVAFIACPCHLPFTLPLLVSLTAGTAFGAWLSQNTILVGVISTVAFIGGLALAFKWFSQPACAARPILNAPSPLSKVETSR